MECAPISRRGARVLLIDADARVLLLHGFDPARPDVSYWFTIGGGVDDGESDREGAARELFEECGLRADPDDFVGPVFHEVAEFPFDGRQYRQEQDFFLLRVPSLVVDTSGFEPYEAASVDAHRWWSAAELRETVETFYPPQLPDLIDGLLGH
jgi:8-oxo-dGTP pyrophosphatase MutT (NUDIX family)